MVTDGDRQLRGVTVGRVTGTFQLRDSTLSLAEQQTDRHCWALWEIPPLFPLPFSSTLQCLPHCLFASLPYLSVSPSSSLLSCIHKGAEANTHARTHTHTHTHTHTRARAHTHIHAHTYPLTQQITVKYSSAFTHTNMHLSLSLSLSLSPASRAEDSGFESRLRRDFYGVESYQ